MRFFHLNERFLKLPGTIGVVTISVLVSILILIAGKTNKGIAATIILLADSIDFSTVLPDVMLGFLLFASALHFDYRKLKEQRLPVLLLSTIGVVVSTLLISTALVCSISVIAHQLHASIRLSAVTAGLIIGNESLGASHIADKFLSRIWQLIDEVLNTILFVMIGLELVIMPFLNNYWLIGLLSIMVVLIARLVSVSLPAFFIAESEFQ